MTYLQFIFFLKPFQPFRSDTRRDDLKLPDMTDKENGRRIAALSLLLILAILLKSTPAYGSAASTVKTDIVDESLTGGSGDADSSESWATWAKEKITEGLGIKHPQHEEKAKEVVSEAGEQAKNRAGNVKDSFIDATKGGAENIAEKSGEAKETATEHAKEAKDSAMNKAGEAKESASKKSGDVTGAAEDKTGKVKDAAEHAAEMAAGKAKDGYEAAKSKAGEKLDAAKEGAASSLGAAKEGAASSLGAAKEGVGAAKDGAASSLGSAKEKVVGGRDGREEL